MRDPAALAVHRPICDPGELCGEVQIDLNNAGLRHEFDRAAQLATQAVLAEKLSGSANAQQLWRDIFGPDFPAPPGPVTIGGAAGTGAVVGYQPVKDSPQG